MEHVKKSTKTPPTSATTSAGPVLQKAKQMEEEGHKIIKLNIGNLAAFGFESPEEIAAGHDPQPAERQPATPIRKGLFAARKAVMHYYPAKGYQGRDASKTSTSATACPS